MNKQEVIEEFCKLSALVGEDIFKNQEAFDCFCGENQLSGFSYNFSAKIMDFIQTAVKEKIGREKAKIDAKNIEKDHFARLKFYANSGNKIEMIKALRCLMNGFWNYETMTYKNGLLPDRDLGLYEAKNEIEQVFDFKLNRFNVRNWVCKGILLGHMDDETGVWVWENL